MKSWQVVEALGYAYYIERGYRVLVPIVSNEGYDFVAEKQGQYIRVNVKCAGLKDKNLSNSWCISQASGSFTNRGDRRVVGVDVYLAYLPNHDRFIELPGDFFDDIKSKSKRIPLSMFLA